jgi:hypothetical protein
VQNAARIGVPSTETSRRTAVRFARGVLSRSRPSPTAPSCERKGRKGYLAHGETTRIVRCVRRSEPIWGCLARAPTSFSALEKKRSPRLGTGLQLCNPNWGGPKRK